MPGNVMERCCVAGSAKAAEKAVEAAEAARKTAQGVGEAVSIAADALAVAREAEKTSNRAAGDAAEALSAAKTAADAASEALNAADAVRVYAQGVRIDFEAHSADSAAHPCATHQSPGFMSAEDKTRLDAAESGIGANAQSLAEVAGDVKALQTSVSGLEQTVADLAESASGSGGQCRGDIKMWFGELDESGKHPVVSGVIDQNWHVCDGTDGTPDLRDRVPLGASTGKAMGTTGGSASHSHTVSVSVSAHAATAVSGSTGSGSVSLSGTSGSASPSMTASASSTTAGGTVGSTTLTASQMPYHKHVIDTAVVSHDYQLGATPMGLACSAIGGTTMGAGGSGSHTHAFTGRSHTHTISVGGGSHAHSMGLSGGSHSHGAGTLKTPELAHTSSGSAASSSTLQPYVAVHFLMYTGERS